MAGGLALALSGGGARGAFQVGVLDELINVKGVEFETVTGTSTGAIQAAAVAQKEVERLVEFWLGITGNSSIYKGSDKLLSVAWALIRGKEALFNPAPLRHLLGEFYDDEAIKNSGIALRMAIVNIANGDLKMVPGTAGHIADWVYASSAQPPFFPPLVDSEGNKWVDGGIRDYIPLRAALELRPRAALVVRAEAPLPPSLEKFDDILEIGLQSVELMIREVGRGDEANVKLMNQLLDAADAQRAKLTELSMPADQIEQVMAPIEDRFEEHFFSRAMVIEPPTELYERLEFDPPLIRANIERGREAVRCRWSEIAAFLGVPE
ncbi:patatin-like phospholipase family protein [uncultured Erythrobacter sp.]|uniref:patatin-like phospholipase family protein n=1 Tax=uncultured Erythrobacter sp. TaxID=263913 RepID=UPI00263013BB|nr:patatin-like phospholipase family protein [uncultured Erythrobacter sp.]